MRPFRPWLRNLKGAAYAWAIATAAGATWVWSWKHQAEDVLVIIAAFTTLLAFSAGVRQLSLARRRRYGQKLERDVIAPLCKSLAQHGLRYRCNVMMRYGGDIDVVCHQADGTAIPIEVKSFVRWRQWWIFAGERERKALDQSKRQIHALSAPRGYIWLPNGKPTMFQRLFTPGYGQTRVLFGHASKVAKAAQR